MEFNVRELLLRRQVVLWLVDAPLVDFRGLDVRDQFAGGDLRRHEWWDGGSTVYRGVRWLWHGSLRLARWSARRLEAVALLVCGMSGGELLRVTLCRQRLAPRWLERRVPRRAPIP